jgi:ATP synthase subunit 6
MFLFSSPLEQFQILPIISIHLGSFDFSITNSAIILAIGLASCIFTLFTFILISNIIGLVPYSFTVTSHLIVTFALALMTFIGINLICIREHGINMLSLFLPPGSSMVLAFLLVPIEIVSYIFRPISLSVRLFANMMAGHTLLKVIAGFAWTMMLAGGGLLVAHVIPLAILVVLMLLEFGVAVIQAYVFTILTCIYLNDAIHLH